VRAGRQAAGKPNCWGGVNTSIGYHTETIMSAGVRRIHAGKQIGSFRQAGQAGTGCIVDQISSLSAIVVFMRGCEDAFSHSAISHSSSGRGVARRQPTDRAREPRGSPTCRQDGVLPGTQDNLNENQKASTYACKCILRPEGYGRDRHSATCLPTHQTRQSPWRCKAVCARCMHV
jgi:hypothetical protein